MKKYSIFFIVILSLFLFIGCNSSSNNQSTSNITAPSNIDLDIKGTFDVNGYKVLDNNIATNEYIYETLSGSVKISNNTIELGNKIYDDVKYKLKFVDSDYVLSYEKKYTLKDLGVNNDNIKIYSITYDNNLLCEIIYTGKKKSYIYYQGILFDISFNNDKDSDKESKKAIKANDTESKDGTLLSEGFLLGLRSKPDSKNNMYVSESYRTIFISSKNGKFQRIKQRNNIIFPRKSGMWELKKNYYKNNNNDIYCEYFSVNNVNSNSSDENSHILDKLPAGTTEKQQINYVGSDYVATEIESNSKNAESCVYKVLPVDNLMADNGINISDVYNNSEVLKFEKEYKKACANIVNKSEIPKNINYSNFTIKRDSGKWILLGRISPISSDGVEKNFYLDISPNGVFVSDDTLTVPWKIIKGEIPLLVDAFTSPSGNMAIIISENEISIYQIKDGVLSEQPLDRVELNNGESVVMAKWCKSNYVDKWSSVFYNSTIIG